MQCFFCPNPAASPATGCEYSERVVACEACTRAFWKWARQHMHPRKGLPDFYAAAGKWRRDEALAHR